MKRSNIRHWIMVAAIGLAAVTVGCGDRTPAPPTSSAPPQPSTPEPPEVTYDPSTAAQQYLDKHTNTTRFR